MGPKDNAINFFLVNPKYNALLDLLRELRTELEIAVPRKEVRLPEVPTEDDIRRFYQAVWNCRNFVDMVLIKTLFYTGLTPFMIQKASTFCQKSRPLLQIALFPTVSLSGRYL